jgi:cbb3-type cytochrome oxidase maturation protein
MSISYLLVVLGLAAFGGAVWALFWAVDSGQYDDLEAEGGRILDEPAAEPATSDRPSSSYPSQSS